jgi:hypothetical protein
MTPFNWVIVNGVLQINVNSVLIEDSGSVFANLPTADPGRAGYLWIDTAADRVVKSSAG